MAKPFMYFATRDTYHFLVLVAVVPAVLAVVVLLLRVKERTPLQREEATSSPRAGRFPREFKLFIVIMVLFTLGELQRRLLGTTGA